MTERAIITVRGLVQGVGFRWHVCRQAAALGLTGSVRNAADGSVRIVAEGPRPALEALLAWARCGPPHADVDSAEAVWAPGEDSFSGFVISG